MTGMPIQKGLAELEALFDKLEQIQAVFQKPEVCSIRIVANPERMVIREAKRAYAYLQLYGYNVDAIVVNRILPKEETGKTFEYYLKAQDKYLQEIEDSFHPLPILKVHHQGREVFGENLLEAIGETAYESHTASEVLHLDRPFEVVDTKAGYDVKIKLPMVDMEAIDLKKFGDELVLNVNSRRRTIILPRFANLLQLKGYYFSAPWLVVELVK